MLILRNLQDISKQTKDPNTAKEIFDTKNVKVLFQFVADVILKFLFNGNENYQFNDENNVFKTFELITIEKVTKLFK
jgi:hypothetical protein